jgi:Transposase
MKRSLQTVQSAAAPQPHAGNTIGIDLGDRWSRYCVLDASGGIVEEDRVRTTADAMQEKFGKLAPARVVIEAGTHSPWVGRLLEEFSHQVIVANPRKVRLIYESDRKNDRLDARMLARLGRVDVSLLSPVWHRSAEAQADLAVIRSRDALGGGTHPADQCGAWHGEEHRWSAAHQHDCRFCREDSGTGANSAETRHGATVEKHLRPQPADPVLRRADRALGREEVPTDEAVAASQGRGSADCADLRVDGG